MAYNKSMGLLSRFNKLDSTPLHSSGFAAANDGSDKALGAMRHESFEQRLQIESNRTHIKSYRDSSLAQQSLRPPLTSKVPERAQTSAPATRIDIVKPSRQQVNAQMISRPTVYKANFSEPKPRGFNPYS
jgi:hypothetical protein